MNETLSPRQTQIMSLIAKGCGSKEIANLLQCSPHTIGTHLRSIFQKLDACTRAEAVSIWLRTPDEPSHKRVTHRRAATDKNASGVNLGLSEKELLKSWSFTNAIRSLVDRRCVGGVELEASEAVAERFQVPTNGFYIPADVSTRALNATSLTAGGYAAKTDTSKSLIEFLYAQSRVVSLGATVLNDLTGSLCIPKQTSAATVGWATETGTATTSSPTFGQLLLSPKRITAATTVSWQLLAQTSGSVEALSRRDFVRAIATELNFQALSDAGGAAPLGILNTAGVGSITFGGAASWAKIADFEAAVGNANVDGAAFLTSPDVRKKFRTVQKQSASGQYLWPDGSALMGYNAATSTNVTGDKLLFGNWSELIIADWGQLEVLVDFYTLSLTGEIRLVAHQFMDVGLRHPESFCISTDSAAQ